MDPWTIALWTVLVACLIRAGRRAIGALGGSSDVMGSLFVPPDRRLGWPRGVQESDEPWGWQPPDVMNTVPTTPVGPAPVGAVRSHGPGQPR